MSNEYNVIGVGFGPSNIALAVALQEKYPESNFVFLEKRARVDWQPNMLLSGSDIQNNPLRDFVTPRNPKSHYGFINYLKEQNRLFDFLNLPLHYPLRSEYAGYVRWVASHFENNVILNAEVESVTYDRTSSEYPWVISSKEGTTYRTKNLIWGTGREPNIPEVYKHALGDSVFHLNDFESEITIGEDETETIAVLGASQSAVEIILDLANRYPDKKLFLFREALVSASKTQVHLVIMFIFRILSLTTMLLNQKKKES
ncbi:L-ornithine N(5)-monooxygenase [Sodalis praecaptivus]